MKIAVTGCNSVVPRALQLGHTVVGIDHVAEDDTEFCQDSCFVPAEQTSFDETLKAFEGCNGMLQLAAIRQLVDYKVNTHN
ncbi:hypothetical protein V8E55_002580, partial [Tylopilus felleus]